jgi:nicotinate-nucleotide adenylyltransferase
MNIGLFFGSFNPIHSGHMIIAQTMLERTDIEELWFIVSPQNPFKKNKSLLHEFDRLDLVEVATRENPKFKAVDVEFNMPRPSYTIDTLVVLSEKHPEHSFKLIIGEDNLASFEKWKNHSQILKNYGLLIYPRPNSKESSIKSHERSQIVKAPMLDISATFIRNSIKEGYSIKYLVPENVEKMINSKDYYSV